MLFYTFIMGLLLTAQAQWIANPREQVSPRNLAGFAGRELLTNGLSRRAICPAGQNACGSGCAVGPCCDGTTGLSCRSDEYCATVDGAMSCCPNGYTCTSTRQCQNADTPGCTPGAIFGGKLCCDSSAPFCNTAGTEQFCQPYLTGVAYPNAHTVTVVLAPTQCIVTVTTISASTTSAVAVERSTSTSLIVVTPPTQITTVTSASTATMTLPVSTITGTVLSGSGLPAGSVYISVLYTTLSTTGTGTVIIVPISTTTEPAPSSTAGSVSSSLTQPTAAPSSGERLLPGLFSAMFGAVLAIIVMY